MVQLNLLPDVKIEYIQSKRQKSLVMSIAVLVVLVSLGITILLAVYVYGFQNWRLSALDDTIAQRTKEIESQQSLDQVLTIQNQLNALDQLHDQKPVASRLFGFLAQAIPASSKLKSADLDLVANTLTISGTTSSPTEANKLVDTLKFAEIVKADKEPGDQNEKAFSSVVLNLSLEKDRSSFSVTMSYNPILFASDQEGLTIFVPNQPTTRSITEQPVFGEVKQGEGGQ